MSKISSIIEEIERLEKELETEVQKNAKAKESAIQEPSYKSKDFFTYLKEVPFLVLLSSPIIYAMVIPAVILDIFLWVYQNINFRIYKIPIVKRKNYVVYDRQKLKYLHPIEKLGCVYCSYFNGVMAYSSEVASRTELYFCPIKHKKKIFYRHKYYKYFVDYGDAQSYNEKLEELRGKLKEV